MAPTWAVPGLLVGVFEKKHDSYWLVFFRQFNAIGPFFLFICSTFWPTNFLSEKQGSVGSSLALNHKFFMPPKVEGRPKGPFAVFSALCDIFPKIFEFYQRVPR